MEGSPYWVDLWADINGYKIGLQVKPSTYQSANLSIYMGKARSSEEAGQMQHGTGTAEPDHEHAERNIQQSVRTVSDHKQGCHGSTEGAGTADGCNGGTGPYR